jgi:hypothetical protein
MIAWEEAGADHPKDACVDHWGEILMPRVELLLPLMTKNGVLSM